MNQSNPASGQSTEHLIVARNYCFRYPESSRDVLCDLSFSIDEGSLTLLCGLSGSGKTTLLRELKKELRLAGKRQGQLSIFEPSLPENLDSTKVAFVMQNPTNQIVHDSVWHELAFGLENQGLSNQVIERRIAEIAHFFDIEPWIDKRVSELSGGEKQILNLASNLVMQPELLLLDEPTAQLDPIARRQFLQLLNNVHEETGVTIIITEHVLEDILEMSDHVLWLTEGRIGFNGKPHQFAAHLLKRQVPFAQALPVASRLYADLQNELQTDFNELNKQPSIPLSVRQGRVFLKKHLAQRSAYPEANARQAIEELAGQTCDANSKSRLLIRAENLWFRYAQQAPYVLKDTCFDLREGEIHALLGGNGSGKSTLLYLLCRALTPVKGKFKASGSLRIAMLSQNPQAIFATESAAAELHEFQKRFAYTDDTILEMAERFSLNHLLHRHPYDLSGGEMQKLALAKALLTKPDVLLLDEPVKGLDTVAKREIQEYLASLKKTMSFVIVSHDLDFVASVADRCSMLFDGHVIATADCEPFFQRNTYFTTSVYRLTRGLANECIKPSCLTRLRPEQVQ